MGEHAVWRLGRWLKAMLWPGRGLFVLGTLGGIAVMLGQQVQIQLFGAVVAGLADAASTARCGGACPGGPAAPPPTPWFVPDDLGSIALALVLVIAGMIALAFLVEALNARAQALITARLQGILHDKILALGPVWSDRRDAAEGIEVVGQIARGAVPMAIQLARFPVVQGVGMVSAILLLWYNLGNLPETPPALRVLGIAALIGVPLISWWLSGRLRAAQSAVLDAERSLSTEVMNSMAQPLEIRAVGGEAARSRRIGGELAKAAAARIRMAVRMTLSTQFTISTPTILQALFLAYGVLVVVTTETLDPVVIGAIITIHGFVPQVVTPVMGLISFFGGLNAQMPLFEKVGGVLDAAPDIVDPAEPAPWSQTARRVALEDVTFAYAPDKPTILDGLSHAFVPGETTAVVGRSGCGKSTIVQLVARLRRPLSGTVSIAGISVDRYANDDLRAKVAVVSQFPPILTDTVRANLTLAKSDATDAEIEAACRKTGLWDVLVRKNPDAPLDQPMMREAGRNFSGGERRLVAITRLMLRQPDVFLFDEPAAGIDAQSLETVIAAIRVATAGTTTILVEHDLDLVRALAHQVCVLEGGRFVQVGPPEQLAVQPGPFRDLVEARRRLVAGDRRMDVESFPVPRIEDAGPAPVQPGAAMPMPGAPKTGAPGGLAMGFKLEPGTPPVAKEAAS